VLQLGVCGPDARRQLLSDKGLLLLRQAETRRLLNVSSKEAGEKALRRLGQLRNNLAHSQDIVTEDWEMILRLAEGLENIVNMGSAFTRPRRARPRKKKARHDSV
jgi:hypothetical protein